MTPRGSGVLLLSVNCLSSTLVIRSPGCGIGLIARNPTPLSLRGFPYAQDCSKKVNPSGDNPPTPVVQIFAQSLLPFNFGPST